MLSGGGFNSPSLSTIDTGAASNGMSQALSQTPPIGPPGALPAAPVSTPSAMPGADPYANGIGTTGPQAAAPNGSTMLQKLYEMPGDAIKWATKSDANSRLMQGGMQVVAAIGKSVGDQEAIKTQIALQEKALQRSRDRLNASIAPVKMPTYSKG